MSRPDDPSSRPVSKPNLKPVSIREAAKSRPGKKKAEEKVEEQQPAVVQGYDADFGVAMMIRGTEES